MVPDRACIYDLQTRALVLLGRYQECLAVLERMPRVCKEKNPGLRLTCGRVLQELGRFDEAEVEFRLLYERHSRTPQHKKRNGLALAWILERMRGGREREAMVILTQIRQCLAQGPDAPCDDPEVEVALARSLQALGGRENMYSALNILTGLRQKKADNRPDTPCNDTTIEMALAVLLEDMGGKNVQKAYTIWSNLHRKIPHNREIALGLAISLNKLATPESKRDSLAMFTTLRQCAAGNRVDTPCDDRAIEMALAKVLRDVGGTHNREQALAILLRLRQRAASGQPDTPCGDRMIELALGKFWEEEGGYDNQHKALAIFTELRARATGRDPQTPSHDRKIEIALGNLLIQMEGEDNLQHALAIFRRLRTLSGSKDQQTPCDHQDVEFPIAICLKGLGKWQAFDRWNRQRPRFEEHHEVVELIQSIRYFREFLMEDSSHTPQPGLLQKAFGHAQRAVDASDHLDPSSLSQLGHCYQAICYCTPAVRQRLFGLKGSAEQIEKYSRDCFEKAERLDPKRRDHHKDQLWRQWERAWCDQVKEPACDLACEAVHPPCTPSAPQSEKQVPL